VSWTINETDVFGEWYEQQEEDLQESVIISLSILKEIGPSLGRPHVDTLNNSVYSNMKELRVQHKKKVIRIFFAFDPKREAIILIAGDKKGKSKKFYEKMIPLADELYKKHLEGLKNEK
jgi:hypothetical protein